MTWDTQDERVARYAPRRGWFTMAKLGVIVLALVSASLAVARAGMSSLATTALYILYGSLIAICLGSVYGLGYHVSLTALTAHIGPIRMRVLLEDIESVRPGWIKKGGIWRWAVTLKGLVITRRGKRMRMGISPEDESVFLRDLAALCPHLELRDDCLEPRG